MGTALVTDSDIAPMVESVLRDRAQFSQHIQELSAVIAQLPMLSHPAIRAAQLVAEHLQAAIRGSGVLEEG